MREEEVVEFEHPLGGWSRVRYSVNTAACGSLAKRIAETLSGCHAENAVEAYLVSISKLSRPTEILWYFLPMSESVRIPPAAPLSRVNTPAFSFPEGVACGAPDGGYLDLHFLLSAVERAVTTAREGGQGATGVEK